MYNDLACGFLIDMNNDKV